ncbi:MAG: hypothetical protein ACRDDZ_12395 [Marinifilaceae bacterium]
MPVNVQVPKVSPSPAVSISSFRINDALKSVAQRDAHDYGISYEAQPVNAEITATTRFDSENVQNALHLYIQENKLETAVLIALQAHAPIVSGADITLLVDNTLQVEKLNNIGTHITNSLKRKLNNGILTLTFRQAEADELKQEKRFFTSSEKYKYFVELNPAVEELQKLFGLEIE